MDLVASLMAAGFTEYEAKVYIELLHDHPATGYQVSKASGIPRSMVYEALGRLRNRGAVLESSEDKVTLYRPLPPYILLDNHEQEQQRLIGVLRDGLNQIYSAREDEHLWSIEGRVPVFTYAGQMIREAERDIMCVLADPELDLLRKDLVRAEERGTTIRALLTGQGELKAGQVAHHPPLESELQKITQMAMVIRDNSEVLIANMGLETTATITRNHNLVFIAGQFVWMELFAQRVYARLGPELLARLEPDDRQIFESLDQGLEPLALRSEKLKGNR